ncbi:hypothetical protein GIY56_09860 [Paracoccus sp. YIM 132242]|uniref:Uncharacterized protein n=1 Tax=Paracoccus lichenicola TaxID=2665644 RepID=A0A6L6HQD6_9RHOB|nr:hypothetical protein [Paracoccus lichenicola]MTE00592.1 hypothetical protein [Paracoccus lichenicola]
MRRVGFSIDGHGPFEGIMKFATPGEILVEFIAIPARAEDFAGARTIRVTPEDEDPFEAPVVRVTTYGGQYDDAAGTMTGYVVFQR